MEKMKPIHDRLQDYYRRHMNEIEAVIAEGDAKARRIAAVTMDEIRDG